MMPTAMGPMIPARMMTVDTLSARDRKVKKEIRIRIPTTVVGRSEKGAGCC
jgi:hypothetical protein